MWDCYNYGGEWITSDLNFDTTVSSLLTLFCIQSTEGWVDVMFACVDATQPYYQPIENNNPIIIVYFIILIIIICQLFMELFVGVVTETFNNEKEALSFNQLLKPSQKTWIEVQIMCHNIKPRKILEANGYGCLRDTSIRITEHKMFDFTIMIVILMNTFLMAFDWYM